MMKEKDELSFKEICSELDITDYDLDTNSPFVQIWNLDDFLKCNNLKNESDFDKFAEAAAAKNIMACATFNEAHSNKKILIIKVNKNHSPEGICCEVRNLADIEDWLNQEDCYVFDYDNNEWTTVREKLS